ncbi:MAG: Ig domain-containing protein [Phycisphaerales bacterium]|nr:Ig domain-containing protein [Phycisphaerales bacterium]
MCTWRWMRCFVATVGFVFAIGSCEGPVLIITPTGLTNAVVGAFYRQALQADSSGAGNWNVSSGNLPEGLRLNENGVISGTPTQSGTFQFTVMAEEPGFEFRVGERVLLLTVIPRLTLNANIDAARQNGVYDEKLEVTGGIAPYSFEAIGLPGGIIFDEDTGALSGTPIQPEPGRTVRFTVRDSGNPQQTRTEDVLFIVKPPAIQITTITLPNGQVGAFYLNEVLADGGFNPRTWTIIAGVLPNGLSLPNNRLSGLISGTPTAAGSFTFTIQVEDDDSPSTSDSKEFTIDIAP